MLDSSMPMGSTYFDKTLPPSTTTSSPSRDGFFVRREASGAARGHAQKSLSEAWGMSLTRASTSAIIRR